MAPLGATLEEIIRHNEVTHKLTQEAKICFNLQKRWRKGDETKGNVAWSWSVASKSWIRQNQIFIEREREGGRHRVL